jgi:hypothetical protein
VAHDVTPLLGGLGDDRKLAVSRQGPVKIELDPVKRDGYGCLG